MKRTHNEINENVHKDSIEAFTRRMDLFLTTLLTDEEHKDHKELLGFMVDKPIEYEGKILTWGKGFIYRHPVQISLVLEYAEKELDLVFWEKYFKPIQDKTHPTNTPHTMKKNKSTELQYRKINTQNELDHILIEDVIKVLTKNPLPVGFGGGSRRRKTNKKTNKNRKTRRR